MENIMMRAKQVPPTPVSKLPMNRAEKARKRR